MTGNVYDGVFEVQKSAELDTGSDYQGAEKMIPYLFRKTFDGTMGHRLQPS